MPNFNAPNEGGSVMQGYVYILTNKAMPGLVKIGRTTRSVEQRADELYQTGVPSRFEIYSEFHTPDCSALEVSAHEHLANKRLSEGREFFECEPRVAKDAISMLHVAQISSWAEVYLQTHSFVDQSCVVEEDTVQMIAASSGIRTYQVDVMLQSIPHTLWRDFVPNMESEIKRRKENIENFPIAARKVEVVSNRGAI